MYFSKMKTTTAKFKSQACSARKPTACPAVLKRKLTIVPMRPGRTEAIFAPRFLRPFAIFWPMAFKASVIVLKTAPIVTPAARNINVTVTPYFLKISLTRSEKRQRSFSLLNPSLQPGELFISFRIPCLCGSSFRGRGVFILDDGLVFFVFAFELAFLLF